MGLMSLFGKAAPGLLTLPSGSFTVDRKGCIISQTLPSDFPESVVDQVAERVLSAFQEASAAHVPLSQIVVDYPSLKITAREMRGGAMIFLSPKASSVDSTCS